MAYDFSKENFHGSKLDLSNKQLTDADIEQLVGLLENHPDIKTLDLRKNEISKKGALLLVQNTTVSNLKLHQGNPGIKVDDLSLFLKNTTLKTFPIFDSGDKIKKIREHIKKNLERPRTVETVGVPSVAKRKIAKPPKNTSNKIAHPIVQAKVIDGSTPSKKTVSGQVAFESMLAAALLDLTAFDSPIQYLIWHMAIVLNLYMHNASYAPVSGYGAAQTLEIEKALLYNRSQLKHPHQSRYQFFTKEATDGRKQAYLPFNPAFRQILSNSVLKKKLETDLNKLDNRSFIRKGQKLSSTFFGVFLGSSGARRNNHSIYTEAMWHVVEKAKRKFIKTASKNFDCELHSNTINALVMYDSKKLASQLQQKIQEKLNKKKTEKKAGQLKCLNKVNLEKWAAEIRTESREALVKKLNALIPKQMPKGIARLPTREAQNRTEAIIGRFKTLHKKIPESYFHVNLQKKIAHQRRSNLRKIMEKAGQKKHLTLRLVGINCLHIELKAMIGLNDKSNDYKTRFTNAVLGFFCGLLNHIAKKT